MTDPYKCVIPTDPGKCSLIVVKAPEAKTVEVNVGFSNVPLTQIQAAMLIVAVYEALMRFPGSSPHPNDLIRQARSLMTPP